MPPSRNVRPLRKTTKCTILWVTLLMVLIRPWLAGFDRQLTIHEVGRSTRPRHKCKGVGNLYGSENVRITLEQNQLRLRSRKARRKTLQKRVALAGCLKGHYRL